MQTKQAYLLRLQQDKLTSAFHCSIEQSLVALVDDHSPIQVAPFQSVNQYLSGGNIGRHGDVVYVAETEQIHFIGFQRFGGQRIPEKEQEVLQKMKQYLRQEQYVKELFVTEKEE